jgi:hypothetical protein
MRLFICIATLLIFYSCNSNKTKYPYSLKEFKPALRFNLEKLINRPYIDYVDEEVHNYLSNHTSEQELKKLLHSEHPILRAISFKYLSEIDHINVGEVLLSHLDDTAAIFIYDENPITVSDYCINKSWNKTNLPKKILYDIVLKKHSYLSHALSFLEYDMDDAQREQYYSQFKKIYNTDRRFYTDNILRDFAAIFSKYKKADDSVILTGLLQAKWGRYEYQKFEIIESNPLPSYYFLVKNYYKKLLSNKYSWSLQKQLYSTDYSGQIHISFINALAAYKSRESKIIIENIIKKKLYHISDDYPNRKRTDYKFSYEIYKAVKKYNCPLYASIIKLVENEAKLYSDEYLITEEKLYIPTEDPKSTW